MDLAKKDLRIKIKHQLGLLAPLQKEEKNQRLSEYLLNFLRPFLPTSTQQNSFYIGVFYPMKDEPQWQKSILPWENFFAFPFVDKNQEMVFYPSTFMNQTPKSHYLEKVHTVVTPSLLLVPGLAFTLSGDRLGRGLGCYDRYLEHFKGKKIGICLSDQIVAFLPTATHDQKIDFLVSDTGVFPCNAS